MRYLLILIALVATPALARALEWEPTSKEIQSTKEYRELDEQVNRNPKNPMALINRGEYLKSHWQEEKAVLDFTHAIEIAPKFAPAYIARADAYAFKTKFDLALADYLKVADIDNKTFAVVGLEHAADLQLKLRRYSEAIKTCDRLAKLMPLRGDDLLTRAKCFIALGKPELALRDLSAAQKAGVTFKSKLPEFRAEAYKLQKNWNAAIENYSLTIAGMRTSSNARLLIQEIPRQLKGRAECYTALHKPELAAKDLAEIKQNNMDFFETTPFVNTTSELKQLDTKRK